MNKLTEIIEGNKLIAEFMGWTVEKGMENEADPFYNQEYREGYLSQMNLLSDFRYHSSWDWLMPVVEKISTIHYGWENKEDKFDDCAYTRTFGMRDKDGNYMVRINAQPVFIAPTLIEAAWQAVVWFIKNYNTKTP